MSKLGKAISKTLGPKKLHYYKYWVCESLFKRERENQQNCACLTVQINKTETLFD